ncbi:MAG: ABC transporter substrate-binding protein [Promethearchaeota archaeon]
MIKIKKQILKIGHLSTSYHTNFILMNNKDIYNDLNMEIYWILFGTGPEMVQAFKNEELDIGYMGLPPAIIGIENEVPIQCVAGGHVEGTIMIGKKEYKNIYQLDENMDETFAQFKGKAIGVPSKGSIHDVILNHYLEKYDLANKIMVKNYKQAEFIALDIDKNILEAGVGTPSLAAFASTIFNSQIIIPPSFLWPYNPSYGIFIHKNLVENRSDIVLKFLIHHKRASSLLRNSPSKAAKLISKNINIISKNYVKSVLKISPKYCISLSEDYVNSTINFVKILYSLHYIKRILKIDEIFNFKFINQVHPEPEHY